jgi:hypothetical protein
MWNSVSLIVNCSLWMFGPKLHLKHSIKYWFPSEVEVTLRLTVSRSVCLGVGHPFGTHDQILFFPFHFSEKLLCSSSWGALSDERTGLYFVVQSVSGGQSRGGLVTIHCCLIWDYWVPFPSPLTTRREVFLPASTRGRWVSFRWWSSLLLLLLLLLWNNPVP